MQLVIDTSKTNLSVKNNSFFIKNRSTERIVNPRRLTSIAITTNCLINISAIKLAAENQVPIYIFNALGEIQARMYSPYFSNTAELRKQQLKFYDTVDATKWGISIIKRKSTLYIQTLKQMSRNRTGIVDQVDKDTLIMNDLITSLDSSANNKLDECRNTLLGIEGNLSKLYFKNLSLLMPAPFQFEKRSRQPALDYFNSALNYLYGMTYSVVENGIFAKGFDPFAGYLHTDNYLKTSLVFDLIEPVRPLIDRLLIELCIGGNLSPAHFDQKLPGYWLNKEGKRVLIPAFNEYLFRRLKVEDKVMKVKDLIFNESFALGRFIEKSFNAVKQ